MSDRDKHQTRQMSDMDKRQTWTNVRHGQMSDKDKRQSDTNVRQGQMSDRDKRQTRTNVRQGQNVRNIISFLHVVSLNLISLGGLNILF